MKSYNKLEHVAIIMDGNSRWAKKNNLSKKEGYKKGLSNIKNIIDVCLDYKIKFLTVFALSNENFKRPSVNIIFNLIENELNFLLKDFINDNKVKIRILGKKNNLPINIKKIFQKLETSTNNNTKINLNVGFNYGGINEIIYSINKIIHSHSSHNISINENMIRNNLYIPNIPDPDILIRTGGFKRLSNFLLFQISYTELFFTKTLWPDFNKIKMKKIIKKYFHIERKYGL